MLGKLTLYNGNVYRIGDKTQDSTDGLYSGRIVEELKIDSQMNESGSYPLNINVTIRNDDNFIPNTADLWAATLELTSSTGVKWTGKVNFFNFDADGNLYITASEKTAPELELQIPDEVRQVYTVDENFHQSSTTMTIPLVVGGTSSNPILLSTILIDKTEGVYLICVGEIRSIVKVYNGTEELPNTAYTAYTGTSSQEEHAGFAYVKINEDYRLNSDGTYAEINVEIVGLKLGNYTEAECRNPARFLYYLLTTAATGVNGWGCGIDSDDIDTASFNTAITLCDTLNYKLDGIMWLRQSAQSWIDQICQTMHASYSIGNNGKRTLFIDYAGAASKKTFTDNDCQVSRYGKNSYNSVVYNKGVLSYGYNPVTGLFMQSAQYENADSVAQIGEQKFVGESYLINDAATALAVLEYTCKRSLSAAEAIDFETDRVDTILKAGDLITLNFESRNINGIFQIANISSSEYKSSISAVKFDTSVFVVGGSQSNVNWGSEKSITPALTPAQATNLLLSTGFDINPDGTGTPYISGTFTVPDGGWLAAAVQYGIGANPNNWTELALITEGRFKLSPVNVGTVYSIRVRMITPTGHSDYITGQITATGDTTPPLAPTITAKATDKTVTVQCGLDNPPYDMGGFQIYRKKSTEADSAYTLIAMVAANRGYAAFSDYVSEYITYNYKAKSYDRSGNLSTNFSNVASVTVTGIQANDVAATALAMPTGSILRISAKNSTTASIAESKGVKDVSGNNKHGKAIGGVEIVKDNVLGDCFFFNGTDSSEKGCLSFLDYPDFFSGLNGVTYSLKFRSTNISAVNNFRVLFLANGSDADNSLFASCSIYSDGKIKIQLEVKPLTTSGIFISEVGVIQQDKNYNLIISSDFVEGKMYVYLDGALIGQTDINRQSVVGNIHYSFNFGSHYANATYKNYRFIGFISDIRIYPRALSASEIKTIYMFPDDVTFGQMTADLIGANIIKAENLIKTESLITTVAQIDQAVVNNLNVSGNATFVGLSNKVTAKYGTCSTAAATAAKVVTLSDFVLYTGAQISVKFTYTNSVANPTLNVNSTGAKTIRAKGANLTVSSLYNWVAGDVVDFVYDGTYWVISDISAKDYSNTELAKKMSIASYCAANDTTKIDGANIYAGSVTATQMAANTITAEKLNVEAVRIPKGESFYVTANGLPNPMAAGSAVPDLSNYYSGKTYNGVLGHSTINVLGGGHAFIWSALTDKTIIAFSGSGLTIGNSFTISFWIYCEDFSQNPCFLDIQNTTFGTNNNSSRILVGANNNNGNGTLRFLIYNGTTAVELNSGTINKNTWYHLVFRLNSGTGICFRNGVSFGSSKTMTHSDLTANCITIGGFINNISNRAFKGYIGEVKIYRRSLTEQEIMSLFHNGLNSESGQITADRIATDAIRSRNVSGGSDGSYTTAGSRLDLSTGWLSFPKCSISSAGIIKATDVDLTGKITATSGSFTGSVTANSGKIAGLTINSLGLTFSQQQKTTEESGFKLSQTFNSNKETLTAEIAYLKYPGTSFITPGFRSVWTRSASSNVKYGVTISAYEGIKAWTSNLSDGNLVQTIIGEKTSYFNLSGSTSTTAIMVTGEVVVNGSVVHGSDENIKSEIKDVSVLEKLKKIRIKSWKYDEAKIKQKEYQLKLEKYKKGEIKEEPVLETINVLKSSSNEFFNEPLHIGAMAKEFNENFGTNNNSEDYISYTDEIGVALRAIQELAAEVDELKAKLKIQQDEKSEIIEHFNDLVKEPTNEDELIEPSFDELLKTEEIQQEEQKTDEK